MSNKEIVKEIIVRRRFQSESLDFRLSPFEYDDEMLAKELAEYIVNNKNNIPTCEENIYGFDGRVTEKRLSVTIVKKEYLRQLKRLERNYDNECAFNKNLTKRHEQTLKENERLRREIYEKEREIKLVKRESEMFIKELMKKANTITEFGFAITHLFEKFGKELNK